MKEAIEIAKVKWNKGRVHVAYRAHLDAEAPDEFTLDSSDAPHPDLEQAPAPQGDPRAAIWNHVLTLTEGDVALGADWLSWVTAYGGRPDPRRVEDLSEKAAYFFAARLDAKFSRPEYSRFLADRK